MVRKWDVIEVVELVVGIERAPGAVPALHAVDPFLGAGDRRAEIAARICAVLRAVHRHHHHRGVVDIGIVRIGVLERPAARPHVRPPRDPVALHVQNLLGHQPVQRLAGLRQRAFVTGFQERVAGEPGIPDRRDAGPRGGTGRDRDLCAGPARLTQALGLGRADDGATLAARAARDLRRRCRTPRAPGPLGPHRARSRQGRPHALALVRPRQRVPESRTRRGRNRRRAPSRPRSRVRPPEIFGQVSRVDSGLGFVTVTGDPSSVSSVLIGAWRHTLPARFGFPGGAPVEPAPTRRSPRRGSVAAAWSAYSPSTFGTGFKVGGPSAAVIVTVAPSRVGRPAGGSWAKTMPAGSSGSSGSAAGPLPGLAIARVASATDRPATETSGGRFGSATDLSSCWSSPAREA